MATELTFGQWLRRRRKALDLTQAELARQVGCAKITLQKIELEERRPSREIAERLATVLEVAPAERAAVVRAARYELPAEQLPVPAAPHRLSTSSTTMAPGAAVVMGPPAPATPLIGRENEVSYVLALLRQPTPRLISLTGIGGTGKTRVALEIARVAASEFSDGVAFVALAALANVATVGVAIAEALALTQPRVQGIPALLERYLQHKHLLLVLDNFEHLLDAAPLIAALLAAAPRLRVLVTSRAPLHLTGEQDCPVLPLPIPDLQHHRAANELLRYASVQLFLQRVQAVMPDFELNDERAPATAEICVRLDGLPLAIELVAARAKALGLEPLRARLQDRLALLASGPRDLPARQQTLRATLDWSFGLLDGAAQLLFTRLAVFAGSWTFEGVMAVCGPLEQPLSQTKGSDLVEHLDMLQALVDQSLVQRSGLLDDVRYSMLETVVEYARERLAQHGERQHLERRHAEYMLALAETAEAEWYGPQQERWFRRLADEHENVRAALNWAEANDAIEHGVRMAAAVGPYWSVRGVASEGRRWLEKAVVYEALAGQFRAKVLRLAAFLALYEGDEALAARLGRESVALARQVGDPKAIAEALRPLGTALAQLGETEEASAAFAEGLGLFAQLGDQYGIAAVLFQRGLAQLAMGDVATARELAMQSLAGYRACEVGLETGEALALLGWTHLAEGSWEQADAVLREGLTLLARAGDTFFTHGALLGLAVVAAGSDDLLRAARLFGTAAALNEMSALKEATIAVVPTAEVHDAVRTALGEAAYQAAWADGHRMGRQRWVKFALADGS